MLKATNVNNKWVIAGLFCLILIAAIQWSTNHSSWTSVATLIALFVVSWLIILAVASWLNLQVKNREATATASTAVDRFQSRNNARSVGLKLQGLGQLSLSFEKYKQCTHNHDTANLLYNLAIDFQIKGQPENAKQVLLYISTFEANFKDVKTRLQSFEIEPLLDSDQVDIDQQQLTAEASQASNTLTENNYELALSPIENFATTSVTPQEDFTKVDEELSDFPQLYGSRYKVVKLLGKGTTGAVFKGKDIAGDRLVAIKVLNLTEELDANQLDEYKFRFHREVSTAGNLDHPNIVKIYDNGETEGFAYITMEYVEGANLRNYSRADKLLHPKDVLKLIAQCADALAYAHKQDVIHRDIKPANILYNQTDDYVKLTDFGIAKIPDSTRTRAGSILGTPLYMSPEQLAGEKLDARSDLYSLGVTLYHLLTGSPPFRPKTMAELLRSITHERHKDIAEINPSTPACIAWAVNKALEKDPDNRFQSAASMANKLRECQMMLDG